MKTLSILIICICASTFAYSQIPAKQWKTIPKNTKTLTINNSKSLTENFNLVVQTLLDNNIEIEKYDERLGTISTEYSPLPKTGTYKLRFRCKSNSIQVNGLFTTGISIELYGVKSEDSVMEIEKTGSSKSPYGFSFYKMYNFAQKLGSVNY